eukprot:m.205807 g.205807  ORF g.205807 m.205807 type:complete len:519 (+) comp53880_c0_seq1:47-1603(+)
MALLPLLLLLLCGAFGSDDEVLARWMSQTVFDGQWQALTVQDNSFRTTKAVPAHRYNHACVTDARRGRMILTMGYFYDHQNRRPSWMADTWAFDLTRHRWTLLHDGADSSYGVGPSGRYGHTAVVHEEFMYVFGGSGDTEISKSNPSLAADTGGELWRFNLVTYEWEQIFGTLDTPTMPHPRLLHTATVISTPRGEAMMVHGGMLRQHSPVYKDDTWLLYFDSMEWEEWVGGHGPGDRYGASLDALHDTAYLFAGVSRVDGRLHNEMFTFTYQNGWSKVEYNQDPATVPTPRNYHSTALFVDESKSTKELGATGIVLFAGANCTGSCICKNDVWMFDLSSEIWCAFVSLVVGLLTFGGGSLGWCSSLLYSASYAQVSYRHVRRSFDTLSPDAGALPRQVLHIRRRVVQPDVHVSQQRHRSEDPEGDRLGYISVGACCLCCTWSGHGEHFSDHALVLAIPRAGRRRPPSKWASSSGSADDSSSWGTVSVIGLVLVVGAVAVWFWWRSKRQAVSAYSKRA